MRENAKRKIAYLVLSVGLLSGCANVPLEERGRRPEHNISYYKKPQTPKENKGDVLNYTNEEIVQSLNNKKSDLEKSLDDLLPFNPKIGKPENSKSKPGIYYEISWREAIEFIFPKSPSQ